jgi:hypothetical protein
MMAGKAYSTSNLPMLSVPSLSAFEMLFNFRFQISNFRLIFASLGKQKMCFRLLSLIAKIQISNWAVSQSNRSAKSIFYILKIYALTLKNKESNELLSLC